MVNFQPYIFGEEAPGFYWLLPRGTIGFEHNVSFPPGWSNLFFVDGWA